MVQRHPLVSVSFREITWLVVGATLIAGAFVYNNGESRAPISSAETRFVEHSTSGLQIVPASCPSSPHYSGACSVVPANCAFFSGACTCPAGYTFDPQNWYCVRSAPPGNPSSPPSSPPPTQCTAGSLGYGCNSNVRIDLCTGAQTQCYSCTGSGVCLPNCAPRYSCVGNDLYYGDTTYSYCSNNLVQHCIWQCAGSGCIPPPPPQASISATPALIHSGETSEIHWTSQYTTACTVAENNADIVDAWTGKTDTKTTSTLAQQTKYTLTCTGLDGTTISKFVVVNIIPVWEEQ